jgi:hypothetical protein
MASAQYIQFAPYLTSAGYHQEQHRRLMSVALLVVDLLVQQWSSDAFAQSIATWLRLSLSLDQTERAGHFHRDEE